MFRADSGVAAANQSRQSFARRLSAGGRDSPRLALVSAARSGGEKGQWIPWLEKMAKLETARALLAKKPDLAHVAPLARIDLQPAGK